MSKTKPIEPYILSAYDAGQRHFGENYVDEFVGNSQALAESHPDIFWHFIGHIQGNKAKKLVQCLNLRVIETVDTVKLAQTLQKECAKIEARQSLPPLDVLVQVLCKDSEGTKHGANPDQAIELIQFIRDECKMLRFRGLMSMGAIGDTEEFQAAHALK